MPAIKEAGDSALLLELEPVIDVQVNTRAIAIASAVQRRRDSWCSGRHLHLPIRRGLLRSAHHGHSGCAGEPRARGAEPGDAAARAHRSKFRSSTGDSGDRTCGDVAAFAGQTAEDVVRSTRRARLPRVHARLPSGICLPRVSRSRRLRRRAGHRRGRACAPGRWESLVEQTAVYPSRLTRRVADHRPHQHRRCSTPTQWPADVAVARRRRALSVPSRTGRAPRSERPAWRANPRPRRGRSPSSSPGLFTTVQDGGRWGHQSSGVPVSGAMDWIAYRTANALVGNEPGMAALEATLAGPKLRFDQPNHVCDCRCRPRRHARRRASAALRAGVVPGRRRSSFCEPRVRGEGVYRRWTAGSTFRVSSRAGPRTS